jgi:hypothetical protein
LARWWSRPSFDRALAFAVAIHALTALFVARGTRSSANTRMSAREAPPATTLEIDVSTEALTPADAVRAPAAAVLEPTARVQTSHVLPRIPQPADSKTPSESAGAFVDGAGDSSTAGSGAGESPSPAASASGPSSPLSLEALGLSGPNRYMGSSRDVEGPTRAEQSRELEKKIAQSMMERDRAIGFGGGGPVVAALELATSAGTTPINGRAVFRVTTDAEGVVTKVIAVDVSEGRASWDEAAVRALRDLKGKKLRMPTHGKPARGIAVRVEIVSAYRLPSGASAPIALPGSNSVERAPGLQFDVSDIGARRRRVVHGRVVDETLL